MNPVSEGPAPRRPAPYLQERFLLLEVLADHGGDVVRLGVGAQLVSPSTPVLFPLVLLLQALQDTADLWRDRGRAQWGLLAGDRRGDRSWLEH